MIKIVLTGGPCSGKTTALSAIEQELGKKVQLVPEAATMLLANGFPTPGRHTPYTVDWQQSFQKVINTLQEQLENTWETVAKASGKQVLVLDRGMLDGAAYTPGGINQFLLEHNLVLDDIYNRYTVVVHLESVAVCNPSIYGNQNNASRYETVEEAQALDARIKEAWRGHPNWREISGRNGIAQVVSEVMDIVCQYTDKEIERKFWLLEKPGPHAGLTDPVEISQGYLVTDEGELRIRQANSTAFMTYKSEGKLTRDEWERPIPSHMFDRLWNSTAGRVIFKTRYTAVVDGRPIKVDFYNGALHGLIVLECEFGSEEEAGAFILPPWVSNAVEVTDDPSFKNRRLALRGFPAVVLKRANLPLY